MRRIALFSLLWLAWCGTALAQSTPEFAGGGTSFGRTADQWNQYFAAKTDTVTIFGPAPANQGFLGPLAGPPGVPGFRSLVTADLPSVISASSISINQNTAPPPTLSSALQLTGANNAQIPGVAVGYGANGSWIGARANGTGASPTAVQTGNLIAVFGSAAYGATAWHSGIGGMAVWAAENHTDLATGTYLSFDTIAIGHVAPALHRLTVSAGIMVNDAAGNLPPGGDPGGGNVTVPGTLGLGGANMPGGATAETLFNGGIVLGTLDSYITDNLYYNGGWKYVGNGSGVTFNMAASSGHALEIYAAPNNIGGAGATAPIIQVGYIDSVTNQLSLVAGLLDAGTAPTGVAGSGYVRKTGSAIDLTDATGLPAVGNVAAAHSQKNVAGPITQTTVKMAGLAGAITPTYSGTVLLVISGDISNATAIGDGGQVQASYGTGTAPTSSSAVTGTQCGGVQKYVASTTAGSVPFSVNCLVTGLTLATPYWLDLILAQITAGTTSISDVSISAIEIR